MTAAEHKADIKAEKDAEAVYQKGLKADKAAEVPYVRPLERPHYSLTEACKAWDDSVAAEQKSATEASVADAAANYDTDEDKEGDKEA